MKIRMEGITNKDIEFLDDFLSDELTEEGLKELDNRLLEPAFKAYYDKRLKEKYNKPITKLISDYLPMIIMIGLVIIGIYLFVNTK